MILRQLLFYTLLFVFLIISACGYSFRANQSDFLSDIDTISILILENYTSELRIESIFTNALITQFSKNKIIRLTSEERANAILKTFIKEVDIEDVSLTKSTTSGQRRLWIILSAQLIRRHDGKILWEDRALEQSYVYQVSSSSIQATDLAKYQAYKSLARDIAQTLYNRIFDNF